MKATLLLCERRCIYLRLKCGRKRVNERTAWWLKQAKENSG